MQKRSQAFPLAPGLRGRGPAEGSKGERASRSWLDRLGRSGRGGLLAAASVAIVLVLGGCATGSYPVDYFPEMHYQQSIRLQEPPRLSPPAGAVAFRGVGTDAEWIAPPAYDLMPRASLDSITRSPLPDTQVVRDRGALLFQRNCAVCHGAKGDGQGSPIIVAVWQQSGAVPPVNLTSAATRSRTDGAIFAIVTHGQGVVPAPADARSPGVYAQLTNMPSFRKLLTPDERWALVRHVRALQGQ